MKLSVVGRILRRSGTKTAAWLLLAFAGVRPALASELDLQIPHRHRLHPARVQVSGAPCSTPGSRVCVRRVFGLVQYRRVKNAARPPLDARGLAHHLRDLQDVPAPAGAAPHRPRGLHRRLHRATTSACCKGVRRRHRGRSSCSGRSSASWARTRWPGSASASTPWPTAAPPSPSLRGDPTAGLRDPAPVGHVDRRAPDLRRADHDAHHPALHARARRRAPASWASPSANRSAPRRCASAAASSPRSPTSAPT